MRGKLTIVHKPAGSFSAVLVLALLLSDKHLWSRYVRTARRVGSPR